MASFPTSAHTFSDFVNGATSDAAQVTDIYDEVEAIEAGYLNGTARLNSSNSTVANLSVSGGSTFSSAVTVSTGTVTLGENLVVAEALSAGNSTLSNLVVSSHSTFAGNVQIDGNLTVGGSFATNPPRAILRLDDNIAPANAAWTGINWDHEILDSTAMHSTASNSSRLLLNSSGVWVVGVQTAWGIGSNPSTLSLGVRILLNDAQALGGDFHSGEASGSTQSARNVTTMYHATGASDYVTAQVFQASGSTNNKVMASTGLLVGETKFWAYRIT